MLTCVATHTREGYRINLETYTTPADIPTSQRKHRAIAHAFADNLETVRESIAAYVEYSELYARMNAFSRA